MRETEAPITIAFQKARTLMHDLTDQIADSAFDEGIITEAQADAIKAMVRK